MMPSVRANEYTTPDSITKVKRCLYIAGAKELNGSIDLLAEVIVSQLK
jgi:hypothetical protein